MGPFKWLLPFNFNDLEQYIERSNIRRVAPITGLAQEGVEIEFVTSAGEVRRLRLFLRRRDDLLAALA